MADGNAPKRIFLRKVLYRLDFQFITEQKQEAIYSYIVEKYGEYFDNHGCEQENAFDVEINPELPSTSKFSTRTQNVYFMSKNKGECGDGRTIKIGRTFIFFDIDLAIENEQLPYYAWFADIVIFISQTLKKMFKPIRMGLRKFNHFYILDKNIGVLDSIFKGKFIDGVTTENFELDRFENQQVYTGKDYSINYIRNYSTGLLNNNECTNELAHLVNFDFDVFADRNDVLFEFCKDANNGLQKMNSFIYELFTAIIEEEVVNRINKGDMLREYNIIPF